MIGNYTRHFVLLLTVLITRAKAVVYVGNASLPTNITDECYSALTVDIACNGTIRKLRPQLYYPESVLTNLCTSTCDDALERFEASVEVSCGNQTYDSQTDAGDIPLYTIVEVLRYQFSISCLTSGGEFCNVLAATAAGISADQRNLNNGTTVGGDSIACSDCILQTLQFEASSPYYNGEDVVSVYSSRTSSCSATGYPLSTSTFAFAVPTATGTTTPCTGTNYTIKDGDTCKSVSKGEGIGTSWLLQDNSLGAYCADFPSNGTLCIQHTCKTYAVQKYDNCSSIATSQNITFAQVLAWNPVFDLQCSNIEKSWGTEICISAPGGSYVAPNSAFIASITTTAAVPTDAANGTVHDCALWYEALPGDYCNLLLVKYSISLADFQVLNPEVNTNCSNLYAYESYCVEPVGDISNYPGGVGYSSATSTSSAAVVAYTDLSNATYIPAEYNATAPDYANGTRTDCVVYVDGTNYQTTINGTFYTSNCELVADTFGLNLTTLEYWNPSLGNTSGPTCTLESNIYYCVLWFGTFSVPSASPTSELLPTRTGTVSNCTSYVYAELGMTCQEILDDYGITIEEFYAWNPVVGANCSRIWLEYAYCVAVPGSTPSFSSGTVSATVTASVTNSRSLTIALQPTITVNSGTEFLSWNSAVSSNCVSGFSADKAYCVGISLASLSSLTSTTATISTPMSASILAYLTSSVTPPEPMQSGEPTNCNAWYLAQSGDTCATVEAAYDITSEEFLTWNPAVSRDCVSGFWADVAYCVGVAAIK